MKRRKRARGKEEGKKNGKNTYRLIGDRKDEKEMEEIESVDQSFVFFIFFFLMYQMLNIRVPRQDKTYVHGNLSEGRLSRRRRWIG